MPYSIDALTADCYEGTTCLVNKFDIHDENILSKIEYEITFAKASELEKNPLNGIFDFEHYKSIHQFLFEDVYDWAGKLRTVNISKKGTQFVDAKEIERIATACFKRLADDDYFRGQPFDQFLENIVDFYCSTNILHPFREGNGRTQRVFIAQLIRFNGYDINFSDIDIDELMIATIYSANGVNDLLKEIFKKAIIK